MDDDVFPVVFLGLLSVIALAMLVMMAKVVGRARWSSRALSGGLRAEGRCVRAYTRTRGTGDGSVRSHQVFVIEFTAEQGRQVRFEDESVPSTTIEGDHLTVAYLPERPERATVVREGARAPFAEAASTLLVLGMFLVVVVGFGVAGFSMMHGLSGDPDSGF